LIEEGKIIPRPSEDSTIMKEIVDPKTWVVFLITIASHYASNLTIMGSMYALAKFNDLNGKTQQELCKYFLKDTASANNICLSQKKTTDYLMFVLEQAFDIHSGRLSSILKANEYTSLQVFKQFVENKVDPDSLFSVALSPPK